MRKSEHKDFTSKREYPKRNAWKLLSLKKPSPYQLVTFRDAQGKTQSGWWTGCDYEMYNRRIGEPIEYNTDPIDIKMSRRDDICNVTIYSVASDGRTGIRKSRD